MHSGYSLIELVIVIGFVGIVTSTIGYRSAIQYINVTHSLHAELATSQLYAMHTEAITSRQDQTMTLSGNSLSSSIPTMGLPPIDNYSINGFGKLGFTAQGTTKYSGSLLVGSRFKITLSPNMGHPTLIQL